MFVRDDTTILKEGETTKKKSYCALCWAQKELKQADVDVLCQNEVPPIGHSLIHTAWPILLINLYLMIFPDRFTAQKFS